MYPLIQGAVNRLKNEETIIIIDDIETNTSYLMGLAENVTAQNVNLMTKLGKGLVYVCINDKRARDLNLPLMAHGNTTKNFTVSIDYKTTTTGISAFERADTIKAISNAAARPEDFKRPGHVFPLVFSENGLLDHVGIVEATAEITKKAGSSSDSSYLCEILDSEGRVATQAEVMNISEEYNIATIRVSDLFINKENEYICILEGEVTHGQKLRGKIGFPTASLQPLSQENNLKNGVYGVIVHYQGSQYLGIMNVGIKPTFNYTNQEKSYEIYILDFNRSIYNETLSVEVKFFVRDEREFTTINHLVSQIENDIWEVNYKFDLLKGVRVGCY
jgi:3,4-dihydroxy-2-butanone 4-phosphate synthase